MRVLSTHDIINMHTSLIETFGGASGIQSVTLLESAVNAPFHTFGSIDLYPTILDKAARLCFCLVLNHPFVDGNKRIGAHAMMVFLEINHISVSYTNEELVHKVEGLASGNIEYDDFVKWLYEITC
jgi:death-on-curing protein